MPFLHPALRPEDGGGPRFAPRRTSGSEPDEDGLERAVSGLSRVSAHTSRSKGARSGRHSKRGSRRSRGSQLSVHGTSMSESAQITEPLIPPAQRCSALSAVSAFCR